MNEFGRRSPAIIARGLTDAITPRLIESLRECSTIIREVQAGVSLDHRIYLTWVHETAAMLRPAFDTDAIDALLRSPTYWAVLGGPAESVRRAALHEIDETTAALDDLAEHLDQAARSWANISRFVIPDTSVYMTDVEIIDRDWYRLTDTRPLTPIRLAVPMLVVDELDNLKDRGPERARPHARRNLKLFREAFAHGPQWRHTIAAPAGLEHWIVDMTLLTEPLEYRRLDHADSELIRQALWLQRASGRDVALVSRDTGQVFRAQAQGLTAHHLDDD